MRIGVLLGFLFGGVLISCAQDKPNQVTIPSVDPVVATPYVTGIETPWGLAFLPDGHLLITDRSGVLYRFDGEKKVAVSGVPEVYSRGQGGLLDIAVHPNFVKNSLIFMTLSSPEGGNGAHTALVRARLVDDQLVDVKTLYKATPNTTKGQHFGSRIYLDGRAKSISLLGNAVNRTLIRKTRPRMGVKFTASMRMEVFLRIIRSMGCQEPNRRFILLVIETPKV